MISVMLHHTMSLLVLHYNVVSFTISTMLDYDVFIMISVML